MILRMAKNPLTYVIIMFVSTVTERIGLAYDNHNAQTLSCAAAYFTTDQPLKTPACGAVIERFRSQL
jgi:hypothetical protein